jgi:hypothetical protein
MTVKRILITGACALLVGAAPASADDASMKQAWDSQDAAFTELGKSVDREFRRWARRGHTRDSKIIRLMRRGEALTTTVEQAVNAEQPSTPQGNEAKTWIMKSLASFKQHFATHLQAIPRAPSKRAVRLGRQADRLLDRSADEGTKAKELLKQVGVT